MSDADGAPANAPEPSPGQLELWDEMLAVQRANIESRNRVADAMLEGFRTLDAADERQHRLYTDRLERDDAFRNRQLTHKIRREWAIGGIGVLLAGLVVAMLFWGDDQQRQVALQLVTHGMTALGSLVVGFLLGRRGRG